jgi:hypothetical protein
MSIERFLKSKLNDICVYWGNPVTQADGSLAFDAPVEIPCFWEGQSFLTHKDEGKPFEESILRGTVHVGQDLDEQGMLFHGRLTDLTTEEKADPLIIHSAFPIKRFIKTPSLVNKKNFVRIAMTWYGQ